MPQVKTEAILLKGNNYRDRSKIVTLYTRSHGKMTMVAKGVRDTKSRWGGVLQSMAYLNVMFYYNENRSLHLLSGADYCKSFQSIFNDFEKMQTGFRIIELINKTTEDHHESSSLFKLLAGTLEDLDNATKNYSNLLFNFEFRLAKILGFAFSAEELTAKGTNHDKLNQNKPEGVLNSGDGSYSHWGQNQELTKGDIKNIIAIASGNFNSLMSLSISKASEKTIDRFFENYFRNHIENMSFSKTLKVINSKEISSIT
jgi:DNA repair protein RecO (recombination protein O)